ncbi:MAG: phosphatidylserine decarboxylase [Leptospirales bacterium]
MSRNVKKRSAKALSRVAGVHDQNRALAHVDELLAAKPDTLGEEASQWLSAWLKVMERPFLWNLPPIGVSYEPRQKVTKELKEIIEKNYYQGLFDAAIATVAEEKIPELKKIKTLDQYYYYVDSLATWIPGIRHWDMYGESYHERTPYLRITQFYYYFNQPELESIQSPIDPVKGKDLSPISKWLRDFAVSWGDFLDTEKSARHLESFKYAPEYDWQQFQHPPQDYKTFNSFFARQFQDIAVQRPVAQPDNDRVIVFPAESTFVTQCAITVPVGEPLPAKSSIVVKHIEWPIHELLADSEYAENFEGGLLVHSFLNTYDYHRQHTPMGGKVIEAKFIPGQVYLEVNLKDVDPEEIHGELARTVIPQRLLDAEDPTGYQFVQCRGLIVLQTPIGKVAILPMGMAQVSSVVFASKQSDGTYKPIELTADEKKNMTYDQQVEKVNEMVQKEMVGKHLEKGEMFSFFQFGGSDCVVIFERQACVDISAKVDVHYPLRSQYGISNIKELLPVPK